MYDKGKMTELGPIKTRKRSRKEGFLDAGIPLGFDILDFWQWSMSDIVSNATRGILAEFIVAQAIEVARKSVREEWAAYDLESISGIKIEVKSAAYLQSWQQKEFSKISFRTPKTLGWSKETNLQSKEARRQADVYVFALLAHKEQLTLNPLDVSQWEFYVLPTSVLDNRKRSQHSITLPSLRKLALPIKYYKLNEAIESAGNTKKG